MSDLPQGGWVGGYEGKKKFDLKWASPPPIFGSLFKMSFLPGGKMDEWVCQTPPPPGFTKPGPRDGRGYATLTLRFGTLWSPPTLTCA